MRRVIIIIIGIFLFMMPFTYVYAKTSNFNNVLYGTVIILLVAVFLVIKSFRKLKAQSDEIRNFDILRKTYIDAHNSLIYLKDENLKYVFVNKAVMDFFNKNLEDIIGKDVFAFAESDYAAMSNEIDLEVLKSKTLIVNENKWKDKVLKSTKFPVELINGNYGVGAYIEDITEKREQRDRIEYLSFYDSLTCLYNRMFFEEELKRIDTERNLPISIIVGDMNGLKLTNDIFGHDAGDQLLKKAAAVLKSVCRADDIIARVGGDEFSILLPRTNEEEAKNIINRIKEQFSNERVEAIHGSISMGSDTKYNINEDITLLSSNADKKMYFAKTLDRDNNKNTAIKTIIDTLHRNNLWEYEHSKNVSLICEKIGKSMGLSEVKIRKLKEAGYLHDIGKITFKNISLYKNSELADRENNEMKQHPIVGYRILNSFDGTLDLAETILAHHEEWAGSGYPKGLKGEEIPLLARIVSVAESYDEMTNKYNSSPLSSEEALKELRKLSGKKFDPNILAKLETILSR